MNGKKSPYKPPRVVRAGSFEELTLAANRWENLMIFGMNGGAANMNALS